MYTTYILVFLDSNFKSGNYKASRMLAAVPAPGEATKVFAWMSTSKFVLIFHDIWYKMEFQITEFLSKYKYSYLWLNQELPLICGLLIQTWSPPSPLVSSPPNDHHNPHPQPPKQRIRQYGQCASGTHPTGMHSCYDLCQSGTGQENIPW